MITLEKQGQLRQPSGLVSGTVLSQVCHPGIGFVVVTCVHTISFPVYLHLVA